jgi:hypothetical protein
VASCRTTEQLDCVAGASFPLFTGGRIRGEQLVAQASVDEARARLDQTRELAALDARQSVAQLQQAEAAFAASSGTSEQASRAYAIAEVRFREGISTQLELSESRLLLEQARANRVLAARNLQVARMRLALLKDLPLGSGGSFGGTQGGAAGAFGGSGVTGGGSTGGVQSPRQGTQGRTTTASTTTGTTRQRNSMTTTRSSLKYWRSPSSCRSPCGGGTAARTPSPRRR